jgi:hypothetical protein
MLGGFAVVCALAAPLSANPSVKPTATLMPVCMSRFLFDFGQFRQLFECD